MQIQKIYNLVSISLGFFSISASMISNALDLRPDALSLGFGGDIFYNSEISQKRVGLRWDLWEAETNLLGGSLSNYGELAVNFWESKLNSSDNPGQGENHVNGVSFSPVFRWKTTLSDKFDGFIDTGVGLSYQSDKDLPKSNWKSVNMGGRIQFEIRMAVGTIYQDRYELSVGWFHYSNAELHDQNEGLDFWTLQTGFHW